MIDQLGRKIDHLRLSVTARCNLDCFYCHGEGNVSMEEMSFCEIKKILQDAAESGITTIKVTGGEPLLREDISEIVGEIKRLGMVPALTTNGTLLEEHVPSLKEAGLTKINIGCDSLTGILPKNIERMKKGILAAKDVGLDVKINMVAIKGINIDQIEEMLEFCKANSVNLQLIELINNAEHFYSLSDIENRLKKDSESVEIREMQNRKRFHMGRIFVETVRPDRDFCRACNKLRVRADGRLMPCLMKDAAIDFKGSGSIENACNARDGYGYD